jgi:two-component system, NarL family, response regulator NreC
MFTAPRIRLIIADDHEMIVSGLKSMISRHRNLECVGSATNGHEAVDLASRQHPDVAILDITMPFCDGLEATGRLRKEVPDTKVLIFSGYSGPSAIVAALRAGALGYVCKASPHSVLIGAISVVALGKRFIDPALSDPVLRSLLSDEPIGTPSTLTPREREVLLRVAWGFTNNETGTELGLSTKTVEGYRARACEKLALLDRPAIVKYALMAGWMDGQAG